MCYQMKLCYMQFNGRMLTFIFIHLLIHSISIPMRNYCVPGIVLDVKSRKMKKMRSFSIKIHVWRYMHTDINVYTYVYTQISITSAQPLPLVSLTGCLGLS